MDEQFMVPLPTFSMICSVEVNISRESNRATIVCQGHIWNGVEF